MGKNSSFLQVPFLNLMATHVARSGEVHIRVGGNTQDYATLVSSLDDGKVIEKVAVDTNNPTSTPSLLFTPDLLYMMNNISNFVPVKWYLGQYLFTDFRRFKPGYCPITSLMLFHTGIPINDTSNLRLGIVTAGEQILGDNLIGFQVGNEPDLYAAHGHRPSTYGPQDYVNDFQTVVNAIAALPGVANKDNLIGPSIASADWQPSDVWNTGFQNTFSQQLKILSVERYAKC